MTTAEILRAALAKLDGGRAWTQGVLTSGCEDSLCFCSIGSVAAVNGSRSPKRISAYRHLLDALPDGHETVSAYNDHPDRTWPDIEALFRRAIAAAEADQ